MTDSAAFLVDDIDVPALRNVLSRLTQLGYSETRVCKRLGLSDLTEIQWRAIPIYRVEQLAVRDALAAAIDLFLLQGVIPADELDCLIDKTGQDVLIRAGLLLIDANGLARARASLFPVGNNLIFSDHAWPALPHPGCINVPHNQVMSVGTDSRWLARATVRRPVGAALDLCTGSGIQALLAAAHSQRVIAVDINPRAVQCTRFNARASGATNIEVAAGDLFEPVGGERFDLITANPPFVPSPVDSLGFRDGGRSGEDVQRRIVAGLPQHLAPGGIAQIVTELGERDGELLSDRLRGWLDGAPMDICMLRLQVHSAASYAIGHANGNDSYEVFLDSIHDWAVNLKAQGYRSIVSVLLAFEWSDPAMGPSWSSSEEAQPPRNNFGAEIETVFFSERLARRPDLSEMLERGRLRRAGPIGLMEAQVLGNKLRANSQAKLLWKKLPITQWLDPVEREVLILMEKPLALPELLALSGELNLDKGAVQAAVVSLLRRGLILLN